MTSRFTVPAAAAALKQGLLLFARGGTAHYYDQGSAGQPAGFSSGPAPFAAGGAAPPPGALPDRGLIDVETVRKYGRHVSPGDNDRQAALRNGGAAPRRLAEGGPPAPDSTVPEPVFQDVHPTLPPPPDVQIADANLSGTAPNAFTSGSDSGAGSGFQPQGFQSAYGPRSKSEYQRALGAGMLASKSPFASVALGEGLERAEGTIQKGREDESNEQYREGELQNRRQSVDLEAQKLAELATYHKNELQRQTAHDTDESKHWNDATDIERQRNAQIAGKGYWEPTAPILKDGKPVIDDATGSPMFQWTDRYTGQTRLGAYDATATAHQGRGSMTADLAHELVTNGSAPDLPSALAMLKDPNNRYSQQIQGAAQSRALTAARADPDWQSDPTATLKRWNSFYGVQEGQAPRPGGAPKPTPSPAPAPQVALPPEDQRVAGKTTWTADGITFMWNGSSWDRSKQ
jgi:hypothetical protein